MAIYRVSVRDIAERTRIIAAKSAVADQSETFFQFISGPTDLPVIHVELGLPLYRLENYRTQTQQMSYTRTHHLGADFFQLGQENTSSQQAQHELLLGFSKEGSGDSIIPIYDVLKNGRLQTDSLLITHDGVVLNGNRRLAAMRELNAEQPGEYTNFASLRARVLPPGLTAIELKRIETRLQMTPQTLLPYDWVNEALAIRDLQQQGLTDADIAAEMKLGDTELVETALRQLSEAELYLNDYINSPQQYEKIVDQKQQFVELEKALRRKNTAAEKELSRKVSYVITHNSDELGRRAYDYRIAFGAHLDDIISGLSERYGIENEEQQAPPLQDDLLDDGMPPLNDYSAIIEELADIEKSKAIADDIVDICENIRENQRAEKLSSVALRKVTKAHSLLTEVNLDGAALETISGIAAQLQSILARTNILINAVNQRQHSQP